MSERMPPPFFSDSCTLGSVCRAYQRLASAVRLPRLVSSLRTSLRRPSRYTADMPCTLPSLSTSTSSSASVIVSTLASGSKAKGGTSLAKAPESAGSMLAGSRRPAPSKPTTRRPR